jgi:hypothetical protein
MDDESLNKRKSLAKQIMGFFFCLEGVVVTLIFFIGLAIHFFGE